MSSHKILWKFGLIDFQHYYGLGETTVDSKKLGGKKIKQCQRRRNHPG